MLVNFGQTRVSTSAWSSESNPCFIRVYAWLKESLVAATTLRATGEHENFCSCGFALKQCCLCGGGAKTKPGSRDNQNNEGGNGGAVLERRFAGHNRELQETGTIRFLQRDYFS